MINNSSDCIICKKRGSANYIKNYQKNSKTFSLYECIDCRSQFFEGEKNPGALWYEQTSDYFIKDIVVPKIYRDSQKKFLMTNQQFPPETLVLELGCGSGEFIYQLQKRGCKVFGVDFDKKGIEIAKKYFGLKNIFAQSFESFFEKQNLPLFDYIIFFEVIEHLENPLEFIKQVKKILKPQGKIILSTPSRERVLADWNNWDFPPHHLTRWNEKSLENIFRMVGIKKNQLFYLEKYKTIAGAIDGKMRSGLVNKVAKDASLGIKSIWIAKIIYLLAKTKYYVMAGIPALFICFFSNILGYKNGIIYAEFQ